MATQPERIIVLETKLEVVEDKISDLKVCLTESHNKLIDQLDHVREENTREHAKVMKQLDDLMQFKNKWVWLGGGILTVLSLVFGHLETIIKIVTN